MRNVFSSLLTLTLAMALSGAVLAGEKGSESFREIALATLESNPTVQAAQAQLAAAEETRTQAFSGLLPDVSLSAANVSESVRWSGGRDNDDYRQVALTLTQTLFNSQVFVTYRMAEPYVAAYVADLEAARQGVLLNVAAQALDLLQNREVAELAADNLKVTQRHLEATQARYQVGEITRTDVSQAEARLASARAEKIRADNQVEVSAAQFLEITGMVAPEVLRVPPTPLQFSAMKLNDLLARGVEERPDVVAASLRLKVARDQVALEEAGHHPTVSLQAEAARRWDLETQLNKGEPENDYTLTVSASVPLYSGGETSSKVRQAGHERRAQEVTLDGLRQQAQREIKAAWLDLHSAEAQVTALEAAVKAAQAALDGMEEEFRVGTRSALDLLDVQNELFKTRTDLAKSRYALLSARYRLHQALGQLTLEVIAEGK